MLHEEIARQIAHQLPYQLTDHQHEAALRIGEFITDPRTERAFILRGYAGTGKTSLVGALVRAMRLLERDVVLLAPTGRAAKVFSHHAGAPAYTIHKAIYRQETFNGEGTRFQLGWNKLRDALFIVDEASMVPGGSNGQGIFGTGMLLDDLIHFVYEGQGCRLMLVGDTAQLPPVGEDESPALCREVIEGYGLHVREANLTEVVRQAETSAVLRGATLLRSLLAEGFEGLPAVECQRESEVRAVPGDELIETLVGAYHEWGTQGTIVVTRSNKRANIYNNGIRARIFDREDVLTRGDLVMAVKNNYHWTEAAARQLPKGEQMPMSFIANGDTAKVARYHNIHEMHGFTFADATLRFPDYDDFEMECRLLLNTLQSESPSLTPEESNRLYQSVLADYADIPLKRERMKALRRDPYYNALQIKYAYAVTCHKAQGGQWEQVFVDQGYITDDMAGQSYLRWLYTAFTRTTGTLYLVNWPHEQTVGEGADE